MSFEILFTVGVIVVMTVALAREWASTDAIFFGALSVLLFAGIISPKEAFAGFSNPGLIIVGVLFIVSAALQNTGALNHVLYTILRADVKRVMPFLIMRMMFPIALLSAFVANTPLVLIFIPIIKSWSEKIRISASKFFIPLSYAAILGGMCTLIGTSTNLIVHGLMIENGFRGLSLFELAPVGIPCVIAGGLYMAFIGVRILPNRKDLKTMLHENRREYVIEMKVLPGCELAGKTIQQAGLRNLRGLFLIDIERDGKSLGPISSTETILADDRLLFVGLTSAVVELQDIPGLVPVAEGMFEKDFASMTAHLVEAVISSTSPILGQTVKDANFRSKYGAGVVAVHRNGERIQSKIGSIQLRAGDTLLLLASPGFMANWKDSQDFYLVSSIKTKLPDAQKKGRIALGIMLAMIVAAAAGPAFLRIGGQPFHMVHAVFAAAILLIVTRCLPVHAARKSIHWEILIAIGCSFGVSRALQNSGAADWIAHEMVGAASAWGPVAILAAVYLLTAVFTEFLSNNAAAALLFPIALSAARQAGVDPEPFFIAITIAASASFSTPVGYQTNLMVQGPGGYKYGDYVKVGLPMTLICFVMAILFIPLFWKF